MIDKIVELSRFRRQAVGHLGWRQSREYTEESPWPSSGLRFKGRLRLYGPLVLVVGGGLALLNQVGGPFVAESLDKQAAFQRNVANSMDGSERRLISSGSSPEPVASPEDLKRLGIIKKVMEEQLATGKAGLSRLIDDMEWTIMIPPVDIKAVEIVDTVGIIRTDFPDQRVGREDLTGGPGTGPTVKGWQWGRRYNLGKPPAIAIQKGRVSEEVYWLVYPTSEGGWGDVGDPHVEAARVYTYDSNRSPREIQRAKLFDKDGNEISLYQAELKPLAQTVLRAKDVSMKRAVQTPVFMTPAADKEAPK